MHRKRVIALALVSCALCGCSMRPATESHAFVRDVATKVSQKEPMRFPVAFENSTLVAEKFVCYEGAFWEDGSGRYVENTAGLMIYNPTDRLIEFAAFALEENEKTLYFFLHHLPPQSRCLVLEKNGESGDPEQITNCRELTVRYAHQELSREQIDYVGLGPIMTIVNRDSRELSHVVVRYKRYVRGEDYYLGGTVFTVHLFDLRTEERRRVQPEHYETSDAQIVGIEIK